MEKLPFIKGKKMLPRIIIIVLIFAAIAVGFLGVMTIVAARNIPTFDQIVNRQVEQSTKIFDRTGTTILYEIGDDKKRTVIPFDEIPKTLRDATIAIEDERFYSEPAFDVKGIIRSLWVDITHGEIVQGASTITQQLARNAFLSPEQTITRKIKEVLVAIKLNEYYSKDKILELYLNEIPYGPTFYGVESASQGYFGKSAKDLNLAESALLAALPKAPSYYSPWGSHRKELLTRQKVVLGKMRELGMINDKEYDQASKTELVFAPQSGGIQAPHFAMMVQDYLVQKYGEEMVRTGGLKITTTLDWDLQQSAEKAVKEGAKRNEELYKGKNAALVAEDPKTGQILALVGSRNYFDVNNEGNFNVATQGLRQPGSSLKPFVYMTAFEKGYTPDTVIFDVPTEFSTNPACPAIVNYSNSDTRCFHPRNYDGGFAGPMSLRDALAQSKNIPAVKVLYLAGMKDSIKNANAFGLKTLTNPSEYGLSLVLGGGAVHLVDLVSAYSVLAQDGMHHEQSFIIDVKDNSGKVLESYRDQPSQLVDPQYPRMVNDVLTDLDAREPLYGSSLSLTTVPGYQVALKTGTSNDYKDAWVVGYTPSLVAGVWAGNNDNTPLQKRGGSVLAAVPIWHDFFAEAAKKYPPEQFPTPNQVTPAKPVLAGNYVVDGQVHSILYYVDKNEPTGSVPSNPGDDPQFDKWETGIRQWASENPGNIAQQGTVASVSKPNSTLAVNIQKPSKGDFVSGPIFVSAVINSPSPITSIRLLFNGQVENVYGGTLNSPFTFQWTLNPKDLKDQNTLEVEAKSQDGVLARDQVVLYKR